jgi:hypothetical protein
MTVKITKPEINIREKLTELDYSHVPYEKMPAGSVIQVVQGISTTTLNVTNTNLTDAPGTVTIYPKYSTSKILVMYSTGAIARGTLDSMGVRLLRNDTQILGRSRYTYQGAPNGDSNIHPAPIVVNFLDTPNTTEAITYKLQVQIETTNGIAGWQINTTTGALSGIGSTNGATMIAMEIAQ